MMAWGPPGENLGSPAYKHAHSLFSVDRNEVAMCLSGLYQQARLQTENPAFFASKDWMVIPYPKFKAAVTDAACCTYGHYYMVNARKPAASQRVAWQFVGYMLSHPEDYLLDTALIQPTRKLMASAQLKNMPFSSVFEADMDRAHMVYCGIRSTQLQNLIQTAIESVMLSNAPSDKAFATLKRDAQHLFAGD